MVDMSADVNKTLISLGIYFTKIMLDLSASVLKLMSFFNLVKIGSKVTVRINSDDKLITFYCIVRKKKEEIRWSSLRHPKDWVLTQGSFHQLGTHIPWKQVYRGFADPSAVPWKHFDQTSKYQKLICLTYGLLKQKQTHILLFQT